MSSNGRSAVELTAAECYHRINAALTAGWSTVLTPPSSSAATLRMIETGARRPAAYLLARAAGHVIFTPDGARGPSPACARLRLLTAGSDADRCTQYAY